MSGTVAVRPFVHHPLCKMPDQVNLCACGMNCACRNCGYGQGAAPCHCTRPGQAKRKAGEKP